jgi:hypothetical protein
MAYSRLFQNTLTDWGFTITVFFGLLSIASAIGFGLGKRVDDFLKETKRGTVDEKIAMLYGYAFDVKTWDISNKNIQYKVERIKSDLRTIGRMKNAIQQGQKEDLITAKDKLIDEMKTNNLRSSQ